MPSQYPSQQEQQQLGYGIVTNSRKRYRLPTQAILLLVAIGDKLDNRGIGVGKLTASMVATALYGLQGMTADSKAIRKILEILSVDLRDSTDYLDSQNIGNALYGLQNMTCKSVEVRNLLGVLADAIDKTPRHMYITAQAAGNALYGLQYMSSDFQEVRNVLTALNRKINEMPTAATSSIDLQDYTFSGQNIGNALWGLRNMTSEYTEVRTVLLSIAHKIQQSNADMNGQNIGNALYSLHAMDGNTVEVKALLIALTHKIVSSNASLTLTGLDVGMALYGLKHMDHNEPEIRVILGTIIYNIRNADIEFPIRELSMAIIGILKTSPWIRDDFLRVLAKKTPGMTFIDD